ncbi:MAG TPA: hypothetical protein VK145_02735, partial [Candidatus Nanoarchaeia archaeon]|nr:hypothetical protein [Candidatus Nanoarchaeia archaeon]
MRNSLEQKKGQKRQIQANIKRYESEITESKRNLVRHEQAREIIKEVGRKTMQQLEFHISEITSLAMEAVFPDPYQLKVAFVERRNKTECDLVFQRDGFETKPLEEAGFGAVDVASFALRVASWSMQNPHSRNVLILDEPFKHLKGLEANRQVLKMIHEISKKMGIQIIMISDERIPREDIIELSDRTFE